MQRISAAETLRSNSTSARRTRAMTGRAWLATMMLGLAPVVLCGARLAADEAKPATPAPTISYFREIRPIFQVHCLGCHQPAKAMGEYVMTDFLGLFKGGESSQAAIVSGKPDESHLVAQITPSSGKAEMPKDKDPLAEDQLKKIRQWIVEGAGDDTPQSVKSLIDAEHPPVYEAAPVLTALDFSPDDSLLAVSGYHETLLYQADGSQLVARLVGQSERIESLSFSPDGKSLAVVGGSPGRLGELQVWDVETRKLRYSLSVTYDTIYGVSWSGDGSKIAFGCGDNTLRAVDATNGKQVLYQGAHSDWVLDTVFSKDGSYLISVSRDRSMKLVEVATQRFVDNITSITPGALKGGLAAVDRHPQKDELLIGGADGVPKVYQMLRTKARVIGDDFNLIKAYEAVPGRIYDVHFNADGSRFVVASSLDGTGEVRIYETDSGKLLHKLEGQKGPAYAVTFSTSGKIVASAGFDGLVRLNDADSGKLIKEFSPVPPKSGQVAGANELRLSASR
jgi:WD40 repeat protein